MLGPKFQATLVLAAAVLIGIAAGVTGERIRASRERHPAPPFRSGLPTDGRFRPLPPMFERLDLTDSQRIRIRETMERYAPRTQALMDEMVPQLQAIRDSAESEVEALLTDEQRQRLAELSEDYWDRRWQRGRGRRGSGRRDSSPPRPRRPEAPRDSGS